MRISFQNVWFSYERFGDRSAEVSEFQLAGVSFEIGENECVALLGRSGSGKTTLMQMFNGLLRPQKGRIVVDGQSIHDRGFDLNRLRQRIGLAFQFPEAQLFANTVREDVGFGPAQLRLPESEIEARVQEAMAQVGLGVEFLERNPLELSEGEKRRVALAGILAMRPELLILDEPTASLDGRGIQEFKNIMSNWLSAGKTLVLVSHDVDLVSEIVQRILVLEQGKIVFDGTPHELWSKALDSSEVGKEWRADLAIPRRVRLKQRLAALGLEAREVDEIDQ